MEKSRRSENDTTKAPTVLPHELRHVLTHFFMVDGLLEPPSPGTSFSDNLTPLTPLPRTFWPGKRHLDVRETSRCDAYIHAKSLTRPWWPEALCSRLARGFIG